MLGDIELGPLDEKYATEGAGERPMLVLLGRMCTVGFLQFWKTNAYQKSGKLIEVSISSFFFILLLDVRVFDHILRRLNVV